MELRTAYCGLHTCGKNTRLAGTPSSGGTRSNQAWRSPPQPGKDAKPGMDSTSSANPLKSKRLTKSNKHAPPSHAMSNPPSQLNTQQSSASLHRQASAPVARPSPHEHARTRSSYASTNSSKQMSAHSPDLIPSESRAHYEEQGEYPPGGSPRGSLDAKRSDESVSTPANGPGTMAAFDSTKASGYQNSLRRPGPPPLSHTSPDPRMLTAGMRQSAGFMGSGRTTDISSQRSDTSLLTPKRYSDDANGGKNSLPWRKKSGFSTFMNSVLGSPRNVKISAPENPVHVTHVGFDNETGQFTVSLSKSQPDQLLPQPLSITLCPIALSWWWISTCCSL